MRTAILSDIHGNLEALEAVLTTCRSAGVEDYVCLGDLVGYGASPNACVERVRAVTGRVVAGNHDHAAAGLVDLRFFNPVARVAAVWTAGELTPENVAYLRALPMSLQDGDTIYVHATPFEPEAWHYIFDADDAEACFDRAGWRVCFLGHSHIAFICVASGRGRRTALAASVVDGHRYVINAGSVGQPRDTDPRAAFVLWDRTCGEVRIVRVDYDIAGAQARILRAGLPDLLAERLAVGR